MFHFCEQLADVVALCLRINIFLLYNCIHIVLGIFVRQLSWLCMHAVYILYSEYFI